MHNDAPIAIYLCVLNEELVVFGLDAAALAGHHGPVHSHQPLDPRLKPMAVPLRRKLATGMRCTKDARMRQQKASQH